ncbi:MAG: SDR family NAD(P)-dependent oxidoreductase, partial [Nonomuraea sp.]|nr:SDR family NAD(P)-dependent oxidoreductase [Nonomuraea sp.]
LEVLGDASALERVDVVQPVLFAVMVSLAESWRAMGVRPSAVVGHSQGEVAAAYVAGALSLEDAARIVVLRSRLIGRELSGSGGMASVPLPATEVEQLLQPWDGRVGVAAVNGPAVTVVSGEAAALREFAEAHGGRVIAVDYASHSSQVELLEAELLEALASITPRSSTIPYYSALTGHSLDTTTLDAAYWYRNLREPVRFDLATRNLLADGVDAFIETSAHPVLTPALVATVEQSGRDAIAVGTLRRDDGGLRRLLTSVAEAYTQGVPVDWTSSFGTGARLVDLPTYAFQGTHYWLDAQRPADVDGWRYRIEWRQVADDPAAALHGSWLVVADPADTVAETVVQALTARGATALVVPHGELPDRLPADLAGVLALLPGGDPLAATLALIQADLPAPLWTVTRDAVDTDTPSPQHAAVWGLGRVAALERPDRWGGLIDLVGDDEAACGRLAAVLAGLGEDQVAIRPDGIYGRRLAPAPRAARRDTARSVGGDAARSVGGDADRTAGGDAARSVGGEVGWRAGGTVLITGGTGAIGGHVARRLAARGVAHLVLTGRSGPAAPGADELEAELTAMGARVTIAACDVADRDALARLIASVEETGDSIRAAVHAAGVPHWSDLPALTPAGLDAAMAAKVAGAETLDALLDRGLDAFVLMSSNAGVWGGSGQGAYAAANAAL